jgi:hypothetical protein
LRRNHILNETSAESVLDKAAQLLLKRSLNKVLHPSAPTDCSMNALDFETAQNVLRGLPTAVIGVVLSGFELEVRRLIGLMQKAVQSGDVAAYRSAAQALVDAAANIGALHFAGIARSALEHDVLSPNGALLTASERAIDAVRSASASSAGS